MGKIANNVYIYTYVLFLLLCNGSVFFGVKYGNIISLLFFGISTIIVLFTQKIILNKHCFQTLGLFVLLLFISNLININNGVNWISLFTFFSQLITIYIFQSNIDVKDFYRAVINCMFIISILSVITFVLYEYNSSIFQSFVIHEKIHDSSYTYIYSVWHTFGWNVDFHRNAGPYWEPGVFACYIAIAISLLLFAFTPDEFGSKKKYYVYLCVLSLTLLSTLAATGYIVAILILAFCLFKYKARTRTQWLLKFFLGLIVVVAIFVIFTSNVVQNKLFTTNSSFTKRTEDITGGWELIKMDPFFGLGFRSDMSRVYEVQYGTDNSANGLIQGMYRVGGIAFVFMLLSIWKSLRMSMKNNNATYFFIVLLFLFFCEPIEIFMSSAAFMFPFFVNERKKNASNFVDHANGQNIRKQYSDA